MTPEEFKAWRKARGWSQEWAGTMLGISRSSVDVYERGHRREDASKIVEIPLSIELACAYIRITGSTKYDEAEVSHFETAFRIGLNALEEQKAGTL